MPPSPSSPPHSSYTRSNSLKQPVAATDSLHSSGSTHSSRSACTNVSVTCPAVSEATPQHIARIFSAVAQRLPLQRDHTLVEPLLQPRQRTEQVAGGLRRQCGPQNGGGGAAEDEQSRDAGELLPNSPRFPPPPSASSPGRVRTPNSPFSAPLRSVARRAGGRRRASRKCRDLRTPPARTAPTLQPRAKRNVHVVLQRGSGEQHAATGGKLRETADGGVAGGGLETMSLVADEKARLAAVDDIGVAPEHLREMRGTNRALRRKSQALRVAGPTASRTHSPSPPLSRPSPSARCTAACRDQASVFTSHRIISPTRTPRPSCPPATRDT